MIKDIIDPPTAHGQPLFRAILKRSPADFRVEEKLGIECSGDGEHLLLQIEKTAMNTDEVLSLLQEWYAVASADVGYCGMKDRHSISSQWISIRSPLDASVFEQAAHQYGEEQQARKSLRLLASTRHSRKLRRGAHSKNEFVITLQHIVICDFEPNDIEPNDISSNSLPPNSISLHEGASLPSLLSKRLQRIAQQGFPNFIGAQRFGVGGQNLHRAQQWFANSRKRVSRQQRSLYLSSGRSALFNLVCAARVRDKSWNELRVGEPAILDGSHSFFVPEPASEESIASEQRLQSFDIHPSAPWWGRGHSPAIDECAAFEYELCAQHKTTCDALEKAGLSMERRATRAQAQNLSHRWIDDQTLELNFSLSPGLYATTLLRELCSVEEPQR